MTDTPYTVLEDDHGPRVVRGPDVIGWTDRVRDAESFARELNALRSENARLRDKAAADKAEWDACEAELVDENNSWGTAMELEMRRAEEAEARLAKLEAVATAAREYTSTRPDTTSRHTYHRLLAALEATDDL